MTVIGITGPTGAGKTTVLNVLRGLGGAVVDCDAVYHDMLLTCRPMLDELRGRFGGEIFGEDGHLHRKALGAIVFGDSEALNDLNGITHRHILLELDRLIGEAEREGRPAVALDAVALLESGLGDRCNATVAVVASPEVRVRRIMAREGIPEEYARQRVAAQKPDRFFEEHCDHVLCNDGGREELEARAWTLFETIIYK